MNTRYGPNSFFTNGSGMAAASSITTNSAWPSTCASCGWMYCKGISRTSSLPEQTRTVMLTCLDGLAMLMKHIDTHDCFVQLWTGRLHNVVVEVFRVAECIKALEHKLKQRAQVLGA